MNPYLVQLIRMLTEIMAHSMLASSPVPLKIRIYVCTYVHTYMRIVLRTLYGYFISGFSLFHYGYFIPISLWYTVWIFYSYFPMVHCMDILFLFPYGTLYGYFIPISLWHTVWIFYSYFTMVHCMDYYFIPISLWHTVWIFYFRIFPISLWYTVWIFPYSYGQPEMYK